MRITEVDIIYTGLTGSVFWLPFHSSLSALLKYGWVVTCVNCCVCYMVKCHTMTVWCSGDWCSEQEGDCHLRSSSTTPCIPEDPNTACTRTGEKI